MRDCADEIVRYILKQIIRSKLGLSVQDSPAYKYERRWASVMLDDFGIPRLKSLQRSRLLLEATSSNPGIIDDNILDECELARTHELIEYFSHVENESTLATLWPLESADVTVDDPTHAERGGRLGSLWEGR